MKKSMTPKLTGPFLVYSCDLSALGDASNGFALVDVYFSEVEKRTDNTLYLLVSDDRFASSDASAIFIIDTDKNRVDQIRTRDGKPQQVSLRSSVVTKDQALGYSLSKIGLLVLENSSLAIRTANADANPKSVYFSFDGEPFTGSFDQINVGQSGFSYKPLPKTIEARGKRVCTFKDAKSM